MLELEKMNEGLSNGSRSAREGRSLDQQKIEEQRNNWQQGKTLMDDQIDKYLKYFQREQEEKAILAEQVHQGLPRAWGHKSLPGQDRHHLMYKVQRYKDESTRLNDELARLRADNQRMKLGSFQSALEMLQHCDYLVDPQSKLYEALVAMAEYADGIPGAATPTDQQLLDLRMFGDFLDERAEVLQRAIAAPVHAGPILENFDDKWEEELGRRDWGFLCRLHMAVVKAGRLMKSSRDPGQYRAAVHEMNYYAAVAKEALGDAFEDGGLVQEINDRVDEIRPGRVHRQL